MKKAKVVVNTLSTWCRAKQHSISLALENKDPTKERQQHCTKFVCKFALSHRDKPLKELRN